MVRRAAGLPFAVHDWRATSSPPEEQASFRTPSSLRDRASGSTSRRAPAGALTVIRTRRGTPGRRLVASTTWCWTDGACPACFRRRCSRSVSRPVERCTGGRGARSGGPVSSTRIAWLNAGGTRRPEGILAAQARRASGRAAGSCPSNRDAGDSGVGEIESPGRCGSWPSGPRSPGPPGPRAQGTHLEHRAPGRLGDRAVPVRGREDVCSAGRSRVGRREDPGIESMVGCSSTPCRCGPGSSTAGSLGQLLGTVRSRTRQVAMLQHQWSALGRWRTSSKVAGTAASLREPPVFENYPAVAAV